MGRRGREWGGGGGEVRGGGGGEGEYEPTGIYP